MFAESNRGVDCKVSIDGKKLAYGFGSKLGDEDLDGHEEIPTLAERKETFTKEKEMIANLSKTLTELSVTREQISSLDDTTRNSLKKDLSIISILSSIVQELREMVSKKKKSLDAIMQKVDEDWKSSCLAGSISYLHTKIIHSSACVRSILECIDEFGFILSCVNKTEHQYVKGFETPVYLDHQSNFSCMSTYTDGVYSLMNLKERSCHVKQHTKQWHELRDGAVVTGSSWYDVIGLTNLKKQKQHYERVVHKKKEIVSNELQELYDYGSSNEINGIATLVGKVIPVFYPHLTYREDGCEVMPIAAGSDNYAVSSGDGSGIDTSGQVEVAFEIKCPKPGKTHTTDVFYKLPHYYSIQVLAEMKSKACNEYMVICYNPKSATVMQGNFDDEAWSEISSATQKPYAFNAVKPTKLPSDIHDLRQKLKVFAKESNFLAEFPSLRGVACHCDRSLKTTSDKPFNTHSNAQSTTAAPLKLTDIIEVCHKALAKHEESYNLRRRPAKEVLVAVLSDLERTRRNESIQHAVPVAYYMSGFSLKSSSVRRILQDVFRSCAAQNLNLKVFAFDGQFLDLAVQDDSGKALTMCRLQKQVWMKAKEKSKKEILEHLCGLCSRLSIECSEDIDTKISINRAPHRALELSAKISQEKVFVQHNIGKYVQPASRINQKKTKEENAKESDDASNVILQHLPSDLVEALSEEALDCIRSAALELSEQVYEENHEGENTNLEHTPSDMDFEVILCALIAGRGGDKFAFDSIESIKEKLKNGESVMKNFTVPQLKSILACKDIAGAKITYCDKMSYATMVSRLYGDGSIPLAVAKPKNPLPLRALVTKAVSSWSALALTVTYCNNIMLHEITEWNDQCYFKPDSHIETEDSDPIIIHQWYAQPSMYDAQPVQQIIDPHHLFVNNRARVCCHGMPEMNIHRDAWVKVAQEHRNNGTGLKLELKDDISELW